MKNFNPISIFATSTMASKFWFSMFLLTALICIIQPYLIIYAYRVDEKIMLLDRAGTIHVTPAISFDAAKELHEYMVRLSVNALLDRNPSGPDNPKLLQQMFLPGAHKYATEVIDSEQKIFKDRSIHQKVETFEIKMFEGPKKTMIASVTGQFIRVGDFHGQQFSEGFLFKMNLTFAKNPDMRTNNRLPLAVQSFSYRAKEMK